MQENPSAAPVDYEKLYFTMVDAADRALGAIETGKEALAKRILSDALLACEEAYMQGQEDGTV